MSNKNFKTTYSDDSFWDKVKSHAKSAGEEVLTPALKMYYAAIDADTPTWAKTTIYSALGYFILPIDAVPDILPGVGYTDDLGVLAAAFAAVAMHIKDKHVKEAKETLARWFS
jgi:uncharacterized membrane protein YkvA (DUF1232 family)